MGAELGAAYKPAGYTSVAPYLMVENAARTIQFLERTFGAQELQRIPDGRGRIMHAEVRIDDTVVMLADRPADYPAIEAHVHVYVLDVDATYRRAIEAGGTPIQEPVKRDDPDKRGGVREAGGTIWWLATRVA